MTHESELVPNPFGKYITVAACTPHHSKRRKDGTSSETGGQGTCIKYELCDDDQRTAVPPE